MGIGGSLGKRLAEPAGAVKRRAGPGHGPSTSTIDRPTERGGNVNTNGDSEPSEVFT